MTFILYRWPTLSSSLSMVFRDLMMKFTFIHLADTFIQSKLQEENWQSSYIEELLRGECYSVKWDLTRVNTSAEGEGKSWVAFAQQWQQKQCEWMIWPEVVYIPKRRGPSTEPWGTPVTKWYDADVCLSQDQPVSEVKIQTRIVHCQWCPCLREWILGMKQMEANSGLAPKTVYHVASASTYCSYH